MTLYNIKIKEIPIIRILFTIVSYMLFPLLFYTSFSLPETISFSLIMLIAELIHEMADKDSTALFLGKQVHSIAKIVALLSVTISSILFLILDKFYFIFFTVLSSMAFIFLLFRKPTKKHKKLFTYGFDLITLAIFLFMISY